MRKLTVCLMAAMLFVPLGSAGEIDSAIKEIGLSCAAAQFDAGVIAVDSLLDALKQYNDADSIPIGALRKWGNGIKSSLAVAKAKRLKELKAK